MLYFALALVLILATVKIWRIAVPARALWDDLSTARNLTADLSALDPAEIQPLVHRAAENLSALEKEIAPFYGILRGLKGLPKIGGDVAAVPALLPMGVSLANMGDTLTTAFEPVFPLILKRDGGTDAILSALAESISANESAFLSAQKSLAIAESYRTEIDAQTLSPKMAKLVNRLDGGLPLLKIALDFAPAVPSLLGADAPRTYLVIAQNNDELRATGGFISGVGTVTLDGGKIGALKFEDSYAVDDFSREYPSPPEPLQRYLSAYYWVFRDANWSPDFPTAVQNMLKLYHISRKTQIDGVISVDQSVLPAVIATLGTVNIPNFDEAVTGENVVDLMHASLSLDEENLSGWNKEWWQNRKNFMGDFAMALREKVENDPKNVDWETLISTMVTALDARHIQLWMADASIQAVIRQYKWGGAIQETQNDYLFLVDSNVGFNKVNAKAETTFEYDVFLAATAPVTATLTVRQTNRNLPGEACLHAPRYSDNYAGIINRCYWDYFRFYVPEGATLLNATPHALSSEYLFRGVAEPARVDNLGDGVGKSGWGTLIFVPRGETVETIFEYQLPESVLTKVDEGWIYRLDLQKQAGTEKLSGRVTVHFADEEKTFDVVSMTDEQIEWHFE